MQKRIIVGICGGTGSGKTTLAQNIAQTLGDRALLLSMDAYYKANREKPFAERVQMNYDHPDAIDWPLLCHDLIALKRGEAIDCPVYDFTQHCRAERTERLESRPVIVIEGILLFANPELLPLLDMKIFVDTDADVRILRRITRDVQERGRSLESVVAQYLHTVKPMHEKFIEPNKKMADVVVPEGGNNAVACEMLVQAVYSRLEEKV